MYTFVSEGNVIDQLFEAGGGKTESVNRLVSNLDTINGFPDDFPGTTLETRHYNIDVIYDHLGTTLHRTVLTYETQHGAGGFDKLRSLKSLYTFESVGELSWGTTIVSNEGFGPFAPEDFTLHTTFTESITDTTERETFFETVNDEIDTTIYNIIETLDTFTYPAPYIGTFYQSFNNNGINFRSINGTTTTYASQFYNKSIYETQEILTEITSVEDNTRTRGKATDYERGDLGVLYIAETSNNEALIIFNVDNPNSNLTEGYITDIANYQTESNQTTLLYVPLGSLATDDGNVGLWQVNGFGDSNGQGETAFILKLKSPDGFQTLINAGETAYNVLSTRFTTPTSRYTYFTNTDVIPFGTASSTYFSVTSQVQTPSTFNTPDFVFWDGGSPPIDNRQSVMTTKSTLIPGLGVFPFDLQITASLGGIDEFINIQTCRLLAERTRTSSYGFSYDDGGNPLNGFWPNFNEQTSTSSSALSAQGSTTMSYALNHQGSQQYVVEGPIDVGAIAITRPYTLYSVFIVPGIKVWRDPSDNIYSNINVNGELYDFNHFSQFNSSFSEVFLIETFTNLRSFLDDNLNINYIKWNNSNQAVVTILNQGLLEESTYDISYLNPFDNKSFYTTKTIANNASTISTKIYEFGGPNLYSHSQIMLVPNKGKFDITRYNLLENSSNSVRVTLEKFAHITCDTSEYVKFIAYPYITLSTFLAPLKYGLNSAVMVARDIEF